MLQGWDDNKKSVRRGLPIFVKTVLLALSARGSGLRITVSVSSSVSPPMKAGTFCDTMHHCTRSKQVSSRTTLDSIGRRKGTLCGFHPRLSTPKCSVPLPSKHFVTPSSVICRDDEGLFPKMHGYSFEKNFLIELMKRGPVALVIPLTRACVVIADGG